MLDWDLESAGIIGMMEKTPRFLELPLALLILAVFAANGRAAGFARAGRVPVTVRTPTGIGRITLKTPTVGLTPSLRSPILHPAFLSADGAPVVSAPIPLSGESFGRPLPVNELSGRQSLDILSGRLTGTRPDKADSPASGILGGTFDASRFRKGKISLSGPDPVEGSSDGGRTSDEGIITERRGVGLLFIDLKDSTRMFRDQGNRRIYTAVANYLGFADAIAQSHDGHVIRRLGDGLLILFDDIGTALDAALEIQARVEELHGRPIARMEFKAAVHGGRVLVKTTGEKIDIYGQSIEHAAALLEKSRVGEVVIDRNLRDSESLRARLEGVPTQEEEGILRLTPHSAPLPVEPDTALEPISITFTKAATLFADLKGWSDKYDSFGRRTAFDTVASFHAYARAIIAAHHGHVVKTEGEVLMATFPKAVDGVRAAAELQERVGELRSAATLGEHVAIRVGLSYGRVIPESPVEDYYGNTVNTAARLMAKNEGDEVLMSVGVTADPEAGALLARSNVTARPLDLKGVDKGFHALRLGPGGLRESDPAAEFHWARRLLGWTKAKWERARVAWKSRRSPKD